MNASFDRLYGAVWDLPIVDWHNHLDLAMLAADANWTQFFAQDIAPARVCEHPRASR